MFSKKQKFSKHALNFGYQKRRSKINNFKKVISVILLTLFLGTGAYFMFFSKYFKITKIEIKYGEFQNKNEEFKLYFQKFIGKNILLADLEKTIKTIKKDYPDLEKMEVKKILPGKIQISFSQYPIVANMITINEKENKKFLINETGFAVQEETENPNLPYIRIFSEKEFQNQTVIIEKEKVDYILKAIAYFEEKFGMKTLDADYLVRPRELHLRTERYFFIWLDIQKPFEGQLQKLKKAVPRLDIYHTTLEYIDLRISEANGEKIIFKRRM